jgi:hypothetical protein
MGLLVTSDGCLCLEDLLNVQAQTVRTRSHAKDSIVADASTMEDQKLEFSEDSAAKWMDRRSEIELEPVEAGEQFIKGFGTVMSRWVEATANVGTDRTKRVTFFHSVRPPTLKVQDYLARIRKYFLASDECYVMALVYIDRVGKIDPAMTVCELNVHRLLVISAMLAAKFHDDVYYSNNYYAKVGGLSLKEVNALEAKFLKMLDWKLFVAPEEYQLYHDLVCQATLVEPEPEP